MAKLESDFLANGGGYKKIKIGKIFEVHSSKKIFHKNELEKSGSYFKERIVDSYPYITRTERNNGLTGFVVENTEFLNPPNVLSFAQDTFCIFYQKEPFFTGNKVKVLIPKNWELNQNRALFISIVFQKILQNFSWGVGNTQNDILDFEILLPIDSKNNIAFNFMESYIAELKAQRVRELKAYLRAAGLDNYELNANEKSALELFNNMGGGATLKAA